MLDGRLVSVIETGSFLRAAADLFSDEGRARLVDHLAANPESGDLIPGGGGIRKMRWPAKGKGKRGGARVVHFFADGRFPVFLLFAYAKGEQEDLGKGDLAEMKLLTKQLLDRFSTVGKRGRA